MPFVVQADREATTNRVRREISISVATNSPFCMVNGFVTFLLRLYIWNNDSAMSEK